MTCLLETSEDSIDVALVWGVEAEHGVGRPNRFGGISLPSVHASLLHASDFLVVKMHEQLQMNHTYTDVNPKLLLYYQQKMASSTL